METPGSALFSSNGCHDRKRPTPPLSVPAEGRPHGSSRRRWTSLTAAAVTTIALLALCHSIRKCGALEPHRPLWSPKHTPARIEPQDDLPFSWGDIPPSRNLSWHPCYVTARNPSGLECARLDIPMDWLDPSDEQRVILAVARLRATASPRRGPLFFNPGGPGGSGIWALRDHGRDLQAIVGDDYDIVSFDPRGIGASVPRIECWGSMQDRVLWELQDVGVLDTHPGVVYDAFARAAALSRVCEGNQGGGEEGILRYSSTTSHARDMLEVLEQMGERRLRYWGFSYGTVLGGTFAAMYPDRVERMVNDGNVDYREWYQVADYINFVRDTDKVMEAFYFFCHQAGPLRCALHAATPDKIRKRLADLFAQIRRSPVLVSFSPSETGPRMPELVTYSRIKRMLSTALYQPIYRFQRVASVLAALEQGDGRPYYAYTSLEKPDSTLFCSAETIPSGPGPDEDTPDGFAAVMCSDGEPFRYTPADYEAYALAVQNLSTVVGGEQATTRLSCAGRVIRPKWRFAGPFGGNTSFPILFINNIADNVTPLVSARNNSVAFHGSIVLVQNSYGHTSLAAASSCTARAVRSYFREGVMPAEGTVCEADGMPFGEAAFPAQDYPDADAGAEADVNGLTRTVKRLSREAGWGVGFAT